MFYEQRINASYTLLAKLNISNEFWLKYDAQRFLIFGKPTQRSGEGFQIRRGRESEATELTVNITLYIVAVDAGQLRSNASFGLVVRNNAPKMRSPTFKEQFLKKYKKILVITQFDIVIDKSMFYDDDNDALTFALNFRLNNATLPVPAWLEFDRYTLSIRGIAPQMGDFITLSLNATDGNFNTTSDEVYLEVVFSFNYFIKIVQQVIGPITFLVTLFSYKALIFAVCCKRKYKSLPKQYAMMNAPFYMTIPVIGNQLAFYSRVWKILKHNTQKLFPDLSADRFFECYLNEALDVCAVKDLEEQLNHIIANEKLESTRDQDSTQAEQIQVDEFKYIPHFDRDSDISAQNIILNALIWQEVFRQKPCLSELYSRLAAVICSAPDRRAHPFQKYVYFTQYLPVHRLERNNFPKLYFSDWLLKIDIQQAKEGLGSHSAEFISKNPDKCYDAIKYKIISELYGIMEERMLQY